MLREGMGKEKNLVRAARGGKSKSGGTSTIAGGGSLCENQFPISLSLSTFHSLIIVRGNKYYNEEKN